MSWFGGLDEEFAALRALLVYEDSGKSRLLNIERKADMILSKLDHLNQRLDILMAKVDDEAAAIAANTAAIRKIGDAIMGLSEGHATIQEELQALKDQVAAGAPPDFTALDTAVADQSAAISSVSSLVPTP